MKVPLTLDLRTILTHLILIYRYYDQDLSLAKDLQDKMNMGRAYCNLGLAHLALGNLETALECQKYFLAIAHMTQHLQGKFRALGNIGDVLIKMGDVEEAVKMYQRQLGFARQVGNILIVMYAPEDAYMTYILSKFVTRV